MSFLAKRPHPAFSQGDDEGQAEQGGVFHAGGSARESARTFLSQTNKKQEVKQLAQIEEALP